MALSQFSVSDYYSRIQVVLSAASSSLSFGAQLWTKDFTASRQGNAYQRLRSRLDIAFFMMLLWPRKGVKNVFVTTKFVKGVGGRECRRLRT